MPPFLASYLAAAAVMLVLDFIWLTLAVPAIYKPLMGDLMSEQPNLVVAGAFYLVYVVGIVALVALPQASTGTWFSALLLGGLLGLVAYGTYDLTNLATTRGWPWQVSMIDLAWGTVVTAIASVAGYFGATWAGGGPS